MTFDIFKDILADLTDAFNYQTSSAQLKSYFKSLKQFSAEVLERGVQIVLLNENRFPTIARLHNACLQARTEIWKEKKDAERVLDEKLIEEGVASPEQRIRGRASLFLILAQQEGHFDAQVCCDLLALVREGKCIHALAEAERKGSFKWKEAFGKEIKEIVYQNQTKKANSFNGTSVLP